MEYEESREEEVGKGDRIGEQHGGGGQRYLAALGKRSCQVGERGVMNLAWDRIYQLWIVHSART